MDGNELAELKQLLEQHQQAQTELLKKHGEEQGEKVQCIDRKVQEIRNELLDPDNGLFTRVRDNTKFREDLEGFFEPETGICARTREEVKETARTTKSIRSWLRVIAITALTGLLGLLVRSFYPTFENFLINLWR
jgi:hypothetical protein